MPAYGLLIAVAATSLAIPIRHDVHDAAYRGEPADYPALFSLYLTAEGAPDCIGTLITPQWAVTAAHCTQDTAFLEGLAGPAGYAVELAGQRRAVVQVIRHTMEDSSEGADLALLRLDAPVTSVSPERLYREGDEAHRTVILPGWGSTGNGIEGITGGDGILRIAENRVDAAYEGWLIWRFDDPRSRVQNALALEGISGPGDSGGPAYVVTPQGRFIAGISSSQRTYGREEGLYGAEEYFVRISRYASWIDEVTGAGE